MGLNRGDQSVTIDLPGLLHSGSSVTTDEHPYIKIDIPCPTPEEQDHANLPLGRVHITLAVAMHKTPWKWAIQDFEASLHQQEAEEAATIERAKIVHSRKDLNAKVKCTKAVMKAKYNYRVAIHDARVIRCSKLEESEAAYSEALSENVAAKSL